MAIAVTDNKLSTPPKLAGYPSKLDASGAQATDDANKVADSGGTPREKAQAQLNVAIVQSSLSVSISSGNEPLALLYKSAINSLNETLQADFGENAIQNAAGQDNSPEATASRIVQLSTGFFEAYKKQNPGQDEETSLKNFMQTIKGGFEQGFKEASNILSGLKVLNGDIASNVQKTYELVQKGYADFEAAQSPKSPQ